MRRRYLDSWTLPSGNSADVYLGPDHQLECRWDTPPFSCMAGRGRRALAGCGVPRDPPRCRNHHGRTRARSDDVSCYLLSGGSGGPPADAMAAGRRSAALRQTRSGT